MFADSKTLCYILNQMVKYPPTSLNRTFAALADPTRRRILAHLARGDKCVTHLARPHAMSLPAVSKFMKCNWTRSRSSKPQNGSRNIASSGKARSTAWLSIWKKQTKLWPRKEISNHVSRMLRQSRFGRNRRDFEWRVDHTRALEIS